jgi:glycosyltransferase involved in cell wall biosynthesis
LFNRFWDYPRLVRRIRNAFDLFHVVDHSYGQLVHQLRPERTIVTCHDLDTFRCLLNPEQEARSIFFKTMMRRTLSGFSKAGFVACDSEGTRDELLAHKLFEPERLAVVRNGVHPSCSAEGNPLADASAADEILKAEGRAQKAEDKGQRSEQGSQGSDRSIELLHVGTTIPRKRIDVLLRVFAQVKANFPSARLLRVGGEFTPEQEELANQLRVRDSIVVLPRVERDVLAAVYRRAALVLLPSEREGFGLPVVEAMACGTPVVASDLPVLREAGGDAAQYCRLADIEAWANAVNQLLNERNGSPAAWTERKTRSTSQAARFSWAEYALAMVDIYERVFSAARSVPKTGVAKTSELAAVPDLR